MANVDKRTDAQKLDDEAAALRKRAEYIFRSKIRDNPELVGELSQIAICHACDSLARYGIPMAQGLNHGIRKALFGQDYAHASDNRCLCVLRGPTKTYAADWEKVPSYYVLSIGHGGVRFHGANNTAPGEVDWEDLPAIPDPTGVSNFRIDFAAWVETLPPKLARLAVLLFEGFTPGEARKILGIGWSAVCRWRKELKKRVPGSLVGLGAFQA